MQSGPVAVLHLNHDSGTAGVTTINAGAGRSSRGSAPITGYIFDFGDGSGTNAPQAVPEASHVYQAPGQYTVTLSVIDADGHTSKATAQVVITS